MIMGGQECHKKLVSRGKGVPTLEVVKGPLVTEVCLACASKHGSEAIFG